MTAGRGDATRPEPDMIEQVARAIVATDCTCRSCMDAARKNAVAAAAVTAEHIAAAIERFEEALTPATRSQAIQASFATAAGIARGFAASGAATGGGDSDE